MIISRVRCSLINQQRTDNMKRVILIDVGNAGLISDPHRTSWPSLGILTIGSFLQKIGWKVVLFDENILGPVSLENVVKSGDVVGLSLLITSCERGLRLAAEAKKLGASFVFLGNDQAAGRCAQILNWHQCIDGIFLGDDLLPVEEVFRSLLEKNKMPEKEIRGFARRDKSGKISAKHVCSFPSLSFNGLDFDLYPKEYWEKVWRNFRAAEECESGINLRRAKNATIMLASGCPHGRDACSYCAINQIGWLRWGKEGYFLPLIDAYENFGINAFYNVTDDFTGFPELIERLRKAGVKFPNLTFYGRAWSAAHKPEIFEEILRLVGGGFAEVNCGLDSGSDRVLRQGLNKGHGIEENKKFVLLAKELGLQVHCSFIFGSPGEDEQSCRDTLQFIEWMLDILGQQVARIESDVFWVWHGSPSGKIFDSFDFARDYAALAGKDLPFDVWKREFNVYFDAIVLPWEMQLSFLRWFTRIDLEFVQMCNAETRRLAEKCGVKYGISHGANEKVIT